MVQSTLVIHHPESRTFGIISHARLLISIFRTNNIKQRRWPLQARIHIVRPDLATGGVGAWCAMVSLAIYGDTGIQTRSGRASKSVRRRALRDSCDRTSTYQRAQLV
jgi:hypothetical protein